MERRGIIHLGPAQLRAFIDTHSERDYLLIDVRQPDEYTAAHIPGALFLPLMQLEAKLFELPVDRDLIFYCRSGGRSAAAAALAEDAEISEKTIYNLAGGIMGWDGMTLADAPRMEVFDKAATTDALLYTAMDLEKGAWNFYQAVQQRFSDAPWIGTFAGLAAAETAHARAVHRFWSAGQTAVEPFESLFDRLPGAILEGGLDLKTAVDRLPGVAPGPGLELFELALEIEAAAYDLYRTAAERGGHLPEAREALLAIAQSEKAHIRLLIQAMEK